MVIIFKRGVLIVWVPFRENIENEVKKYPSSDISTIIMQFILKKNTEYFQISTKNKMATFALWCDALPTEL